MRRWLILVFTGIATPLLLLLALKEEETSLGWLATLFFAPGRYIAGLFVSNPNPTHHPRWYFQVSFGLDFLVLWIVLLILAFLLEKLFTRGK